MLMARRVDDIVTPHRRQHDVIEAEKTYEGRKITTALRVVTQTPLDRYYHRGQISQRQHQAGNELWGDWYIGGMEPKVVIDLTKVRVDESRAERFSKARAFRRQRFAKAMQAVGIVNSDVVARVCCQQLPAGSRHHMRKLRAGLDRLADHFGY